LGRFEGVSDVTYDCKTATVRMRSDAALDQGAVTAALAAQSLTVTSFSPSAPATMQATVFRLSGMKPEDRERTEAAVRAAMPAGAKVTVDSVGLGVITGDGAVKKEAIAAALAGKGLGVGDVTTLEWPRSCAIYDVELGRVKTDAWPQVGESLAKVEKVLTAQVFVEQKKAVLWLKEPCSQIEARVREAMGKEGHEVVAFALR
jgi:hypothetical protein